MKAPASSEIASTAGLDKKTGGQCGFTLVEMLVSLVLSAIIFVSAYQVISNLIQYQVRYADKSDHQLDQLLVKSLLTQIVSRGLHQSDLFFRVQKEAIFKGEPESMTIISRAFSDHFDIPGYRVYRMYTEDGELMVAYSRYARDAIASGAAVQTSGIKVDKLEFRYYREGEWLENWDDERSIPSVVRIKATLAGAGVVEWVASTGAA